MDLSLDEEKSFNGSGHSGRITSGSLPSFNPAVPSLKYFSSVFSAKLCVKPSVYEMQRNNPVQVKIQMDQRKKFI